ncbi:MAG TPA: helix-turn-helix domain-containing protein, partial [Solirubrobacterales bacterium]|nr:helix-turn-helix domain-containing protein [Solirubrobacterales bacterium]
MDRASEVRREVSKGQAPDLDKRLAEALSHPLRAKLLAMLNEKSAAPSELARELDEDVNKVSYHVRILHTLDCIEVVGEEPVRGALKTTYRGTTRMLLDDATWPTLNKATRTGISIKALGETFDRAQAAVEAGTLDRRTDRHIINLKMDLDEEGWEAVSSAVAALYETLSTAEVDAANRTPDPENRFRVTVSL